MNKTTLWILGIIIVILAVLLFAKRDTTITGTLDDISANLVECRDDIEAWETANPAGATTPAAQAEFDEIMERCSGYLENAQDAIGGNEEETAPTVAN